MDPVTLFGIATAGTIVGISFLMGLKWVYLYIRAKQEKIGSSTLRIRVPQVT